MTARNSRILLWLFVMNLGIALGAGLYEQRIVVPDWLSTTASEQSWNAEAARADDTRLRFWAYVSAGPLTLLTLASVYAGWRSHEPVRRWWLIAAGLAVADRALTFGYFIPVMLDLMQAADSAASWRLPVSGLRSTIFATASCSARGWLH